MSGSWKAMGSWGYWVSIVPQVGGLLLIFKGYSLIDHAECLTGNLLLQGLGLALVGCILMFAGAGWRISIYERLDVAEGKRRGE